jgi:hypothetical protein
MHGAWCSGDNDDGDRCYNGDDDGSSSERCPKGIAMMLYAAMRCDLV